jgi:arylsulfatase A-like enzyme
MTFALTKKRMETIDDETSAAAMDFMERQVKAGKPFFVWMNATRMHFRTHVRPEHRDKPGLTARTEYVCRRHDGVRREFFYFNDDGDLVALRYENWKVVFMEQRAQGTLQVWAEPFTVLRLPKLFDLRADPYERADITSNTYYDWTINNIGMLGASVPFVGKYLESYKEFPPSQRPASFTIDQAMEKLQQGFAR